MTEAMTKSIALDCSKNSTLTPTARSFEKEASNFDLSIVQALNVDARSFEKEQPGAKSRRLDHSKITAKRQILTSRSFEKGIIRKKTAKRQILTSRSFEKEQPSPKS